MSVVTDPRWLEDPKARFLYLTHDTAMNQAFVVITHYDGKPVRTIIPEIVAEVMQLRKQAKRAMQAAKRSGKVFDAVCLNFRQLSYKVFQNSVYGFFGARKNALLGYKLLMAGICVIGQFMIKQVTLEALQMQAFVVYGDTDSIMVQFDHISRDPQKARYELFERASTLATRCNQLFPAPNELEVETLKLPFACLKRKMYFAYEVEATTDGWAPKGKITTKGMGYKKRDRCKWVRKIGHIVVRLMLSGYPEHVIPHIQQAVTKLRTGDTDYEALTITCLMQDKDKYYNSGHLIQVETARKIVGRGGKFPSGGRLEYVVLLAPGQPLYMRGETTTYARDNNLKLDLKYYLTSQLLKSLSGLLQHHPCINTAMKKLITNEGERAEQAGKGCRSLLDFFTPKGSRR
jgi:DNA polymerase elongation subunit (family B)